MSRFLGRQPRFNIYRADNSIVPSLKNSFLVKQWITREILSKGKIVLEDGTEWRLSAEDSARAAIFAAKPGVGAFCIVSYQAHNYGNHAVVRLITTRTDNSKLLQQQAQQERTEGVLSCE